MTPQEILDAVKQYPWYHQIEIAPGVVTPCSYIKAGDTISNNAYLGTWHTIEQELRKLDFVKKRVLDMGCRDGKFSFLAESLGSEDVEALDNDIPKYGAELGKLIGSRVQFGIQNVMDLNADKYFDVVLALGLIYHIREPFAALKNLVRALKPGGILVIESGMLDDANEIPLLFCPVGTSPYETSSCSFFNVLGLETSLSSFGMTRLSGSGLYGWSTDGTPKTTRGLFVLQKTGDILFPDYWHSTHTLHTDYKK